MSAFEEICHEKGWSSAKFDEIRSTIGWEPYFYHPGTEPAPRGCLGGLCIYRWGAFGNAVVQVTNAIAICKASGIDTILYTDEAPLIDPLRANGVDGIRFMHIPQNRLSAVPFNFISSTFFHDEPFCLADRPELTIIERFVRRMLRSDLLRGEPELDRSTLVAHFRSGDIFSTMIHPGYGQPPLSFYELALEHVRPRQVLVVAYDLTNPATRIFVNTCVARGTPVRLQCSDLPTDLKTLFKARTMVSSIGTFCWTVACLSERLEDYWFFERMLGSGDTLLTRKGMGFHRAFDTGGSYTSTILNNNWANTDEQNRLMTTYPVSSLGIEHHFT